METEKQKPGPKPKEKAVSSLDQKGVIPFDPETMVVVIHKIHDKEKEEYFEREVWVSKELAAEQLSLTPAERHPKWKTVRYKEEQ